jgi:hypothetical protein
MAYGKVKVTRMGTLIGFEVEGLGETVLDIATLRKEVIERAVMHGLQQRVCDTAASEKTPEGKLAAMRAMVDWLNAGNPWERERGAGPGSIELRAIAQVKGCSVEEIKKRIEETAKARGVKASAIQAALVRTADVQAALAALRAAAGKASGLDGDELLEGV